MNLLNTTTKYLEEKKIENARLNVEELLGKVLHFNRVQLYMNFERPILPDELEDFRAFIKRRLNHEPLQYILGETGFMGFSFKVSPDVLIPRPETEIMVEEILKLKEHYHGSNPVIIDVGTGSGCIPVSIRLLWPETRVFATDISVKALEVARENAALNNISADLHLISESNNKPLRDNSASAMQFMEHDIFKPWPDHFPESASVLVSNPPYISIDEINLLENEVKEHEPLTALTDQDDGLSFYRRIISLLANDNTPRCEFAFFEMTGSQPEKVIQIAKSYNFKTIEIINDLNRIPRVLKIKVV
ncbi:MAG: peptide chain release factor N(5)-glutamine methyltransferase [Calditrichaceae bacterium]